MEGDKLQDIINETPIDYNPSMTERCRENPWILSTFILGILVLILMAGIFDGRFISPNFDLENDTQITDMRDISGWEKVVCSSITATPSWFTINGTYMGAGVQIPENSTSTEFMDYLIENEIMFIYNKDCGACEYQIEYFGLDWQKYVDDKLTLDCGSLI